MDDVPLSMVVAGSAGECIHQIFNNLDDYNGKFIGLSSDEKTITEIAEIFTKLLGDKTVVNGEVCYLS